MKKWLPFIFLILMIIILSLFLLFSESVDDYVPTSSETSKIYIEACARCHGEDGTGEGLLYPGLVDELVLEEDVIKIVRDGELFMPAFPQIPDSILKNLARFVAGKEFSLNKTDED